MKKTWDDIYYASKRRGDDPCYAMFLADEYVKRQERWKRKMAEKYDSTADTQEHIRKVQARMDEVVRRLIARAIAHDKSKLEEPEKSMYDEWKPKLRLMAEGSPEIVAARAAMGEVLRHHYQHNRHHPEAHERGINGMSLLDILEMFCDWQAAIDEKGGVLLSDVQRERFGIGDQLYAVLENTAHELNW